ncbi:hypothetical protein CHU32_18465 [Superficieibacter electus]|uniref:Uncharacterized protein n=1 Tax=Superficieibacter electus TaxID=2022662 RepID=A0A2P5GLP0_9ENTR|nr:hypothetical protein [Superficieibacter electus]POP43815.1 hypothetical protein CHU33_14610 [Superficieibacter electus]POP46131.1 hypothetical protein CHU32_18465 [Superficieibacter electus]
MFNPLKSSKNEKLSAEAQDQQAKLISDEIDVLEAKLAEFPQDTEQQKKLMLTYNRALTCFAKSETWRHRVDDLFLRIDNLRNIIRRNI